MQALSPSNMGLDPGDQGRQGGGHHSDPAASVETSIGTPSWAKRWLWRCSGRCRPNLAIITSARRFGPARPRGIGWNGAGACAIVSQSLHKKRAYVLDHDPARRDPLQGLGDVLAEVTKARSAATGAGCRAGMDDAFAWQLLGQRPAGGLAPRGSRTGERFGLGGRLRLGLGQRLLQILQDEFELVDPSLRSEEVPNRSRRSRATSSFSRSTAISEASRAARSARIMAWAAQDPWEAAGARARSARLREEHILQAL